MTGVLPRFVRIEMGKRGCVLRLEPDYIKESRHSRACFDDMRPFFGTRRRTQALRGELIAKIVSTLPNEISIVRRGGRWRSRLRLSNGLIVSILVARSVRTWNETLRWLIGPVQHERKFITLLARLDASNCSFLDLHVFPHIDRQTRFLISQSDSWLNRGKRLSDLSRLREIAARVRLARRSKPRESHR